MKKYILLFLMGMGLTLTAVAGYATVTYILNKTVNQSVTVGNTVQYTEGLFVELANYDPYTLTFFELDETDTEKHYLTYTYNYTVLVEGVNIEVSIIGDDIVVTDFTSTDTQISITFSLNQEKEFVDGDVINVQFYFEAVEESVAGFTASNPLNINTATQAELESIGFSTTEAADIAGLTYHVNNLDELYGYIYIADIHTRFDELVASGIIVFE